MSRPADPRIKKKLLEQAIDYVLVHGLLDLSLRSLAPALRTNARMLVYHFGSREGLLRDVLAGLRARVDTRIREWMEAGPKKRSIAEFLRWYWRGSSKQALPTAQLIFELYALALRSPKEYPGVLEEPVAYWKELVRRAGVPSGRRDATATLLLAATRGLHLDLAATGDTARIESALRMLLGMLRGMEAPPRSRRT